MPTLQPELRSARRQALARLHVASGCACPFPALAGGVPRRVWKRIRKTTPRFCIRCPQKSNSQIDRDCAGLYTEPLKAISEIAMPLPMLLMLTGLLYILAVGGLSLLRREGLSLRFALEALGISVAVAGLAPCACATLRGSPGSC